MISNIVFTRNRPMQLEGYLESLYRHLPEDCIQTYILHKVDRFEEAYEKLFQRFPRCTVIREQNFHDDFTSIIARINTPYILFGTDDVLYYDSVDFSLIHDVFEQFPEEIFGFSLRISPRTAKEGGDDYVKIDLPETSVYKLNWQRGQNSISRYPFELDSTIYRTSLARKIIEAISGEHRGLQRWVGRGSALSAVVKPFSSLKELHRKIHSFYDPNSLEGDGYRWCKKHKNQLPPLLYFQKLCASAIQINRVNTSKENPIDGTDEHTVEVLNEKYRQGYRLDLEHLEENRPDATHVGQECFRLVQRGK